MKTTSLSDDIKLYNINAPEPMEYYINIETDKDRNRYIERIKKIIRSSTEYRDYIQYLKDNYINYFLQKKIRKSLFSDFLI